MPVGQVNRTCNSRGRWEGDGAPVTCKKVDCGQVPGLVDGEVHVTDGRTTWGARVRYKCKDNYSMMDGDEERTCQESGWSGAAPRCVYTKCPDPEAVPNSDVKVEGDKPNHLGTKLIYTCHEGHRPMGSLSRECQLGGQWSGTTPKCQFVDCSDPPKLENAEVQMPDGRATFGAIAVYKCSEDYNLRGTTGVEDGKATRTCEANGKWSDFDAACEIISCPAPKSPTGGRVSGFDTAVHSQIEFSCLTGHVLDGQAEPKCRFIDCGDLPEIEGGSVVYVNGTTYLGSHARYSCDRTHAMDGEPGEDRTCLETAEWSGAEVNCKEIRCSMPPRPNNTIVSVSSTERLHGTSVISRNKGGTVNAAAVNDYRVGSTLKYRCERGFILVAASPADAADISNETTSAPVGALGSVGPVGPLGSAGPLDAPLATDTRVMTRRCTTRGDWTGSTPACKFVDCAAPEVPDNGIVNLQNNATSYGSMAFYTCKEHFKLEGKIRKIIISFDMNNPSWKGDVIC
jgi:CUB/sushi domain-containing protein